MDFNNDKPVYRQILDLCHSRIISGQWKDEDRIPSVRELGLELKVNAHTALKAYDELQLEGVIAQRRGVGFFLTADARQRVMDALRSEFIFEVLPTVFERMTSYGITLDEIVEQYELYNRGELAKNLPEQ